MGIMSHVKAKARLSIKRIVLPEGDEPRTVQAAAKIRDEQLAEPVLLDNPQKIQGVAAATGALALEPFAGALSTEATAAEAAVADALSSEEGAKTRWWTSQIRPTSARIRMRGNRKGRRGPRCRPNPLFRGDRPEKAEE